MSSGLIDTSSGVPPALENSPAVLPSDGTVGHRWAVVLAGGDGTPQVRWDGGLVPLSRTDPWT
jgi:hypothetical protein